MPVGSSKFGLMAAAGGGDDDHFVLLDEVTVSGSAATISITSAGSDDAWSNYKSLLVYATLRNDQGYDLCWRFGSYSSGYSWTRADSTASSIYAGNYTGWEARSDGIITNSSGWWGAFRLLLVNHNDGGTAAVGWNMQGVNPYSGGYGGRYNRGFGNWTGSSAITEIHLISGQNNPATDTFDVGSHAQVFGLKEAD